MKITSRLTDEAVLQELGERLANTRIEQNLTQAALAQQAGVAKRTLERLESGTVAVQFSGLLRVCRALGLLERFETLIPQAATSPMTQLKLQGRKRQRAAGSRAAPAVAQKWTWGEPS